MREDDVFLDLKRLHERSSMSVRTLRDHLRDPEHPLPGYRVGGKILVRWTEFCEWLEVFRVKPGDIKDKLNDLAEGFRNDV